MKIFRKILTVFAIVIAIIAFIAISVIIIWQYVESKKEISYYKKEIFKYEEFYLKDRNKLKGKSVSELLNMIKDVEVELEQISLYLPQKSYLNLYNHIARIKTFYDRNEVDFIIHNIEVVEKDFYDILIVSAIASGNQENIVEAIRKSKEEIKLIDVNNICLKKRLHSKKVIVSINFNTYLHNDSSSKVNRYNNNNKVVGEKEVKTWLPPFSYNVRKYRNRTLELRKLEISMSDLKHKLELLGELKKKRATLHKLEILVEYLIKLGKDSKYQTVSINIEACEDL